VKLPLKLTAFAAVGFATLLVAGAIVSVVVHAGMVYPTPDTRSAFLESYSLDGVVRSFAAHTGSEQQMVRGADAHKGFATHLKTVEATFAVESKDREAVMAMVQSDVAVRLRRQTSAITSESTLPDGSLRFAYTTGNTEGTVLVKALKQEDAPSISGRAGLPRGEVAITVGVEIQEKWIKPRT
jgi:hypothetical protein